MFDLSDSLLPLPARGKKLRVFCVGFQDESDGAIEELHALLETLGVDPVGSLSINLRRINPGTFLTQGKIEEIKLKMAETEADAVALDTELSPNQLRNLEKAFGKPAVDRPGVILEIFSRHARTKEAKTQVALARLEYLLPRLAHFWTHFERQRGGNPGSRGMGEKQIEVDRRLVKKRMSQLKTQLQDVEKERKIQRSARKSVLKVAIVGYTNAGKSTLLNALTQSDVLAENKLFATLDASVRSLDPEGNPPVVAIDTVGFISRLPTSLIASFRSTLEEVREADLLVHVVDASSHEAAEQMAVTVEILKELGVEDTPRLVVLNKADLVDGPQRNLSRLISPGALMVSALRQEDMLALRTKILSHFREKLEIWELLLPYDQSRLDAMIHREAVIEVQRHLEKGTFYRVRIDSGQARRLGLERFRL